MSERTIIYSIVGCLNPGLWSFCMEFEYSLSTCVASLQTLRLPPTVRNHSCNINWSKNVLTCEWAWLFALQWTTSHPPELGWIHPSILFLMYLNSPCKWQQHFPVIIHLSIIWMLLNKPPDENCMFAKINLKYTVLHYYSQQSCSTFYSL